MASIERYTKVFMSMDTNGDGELTSQELEQALKKFGYTRGQTKAVLRGADTSGDNKISLNEFLTYMGVCPPEVHRKATITRLCRNFDLNNDQMIDKAELKEAIREGRNNGEVTEEEGEKLVEMLDADGDGVVTYKELIERLFPGAADDL